MVSIGGEGDKANIDLKSVAVAIAPEKGRAPVIKTDLNKDIPDLSERMIKLGGKSVFEADLAQNEADLMVNFDEMRRVLDAEKKKVDSESPGSKKDEMQKRYDRLSRRLNVYDKLLNNEGFEAMNTEEKREMVKVVGSLPGFCESAVLATGGRVTTEQMQNILSGKGGTALTRDEAIIVGEMVTRMVDDPKFHNRLSKNLSGLKMGDEDAKTVKEIDDLKYKIREKDEVQKKIDDSKKIKNDYETTNSTKEKREEIKTMYTEVNNLLSGLDSQYKPKNYTDGELTAINARLLALKSSSASAAATGAAGPQALELSNRAQRAVDQYDTFVQIENLAKGKSAVIKDYEKYIGSLSTIEESEKTLRKFSKDEKDIISKEAERGKYSDIYKRQMEVALSEEMKRYWNDVVLNRASTAAEAQAQKKAEGETEAADHKEKQKKLAKEVLDKYLQLSFLKYEKGKAVGWDDKAIKQFVKTDMLSRSPEQLTKDLLTRVYSGRMSMPKDYGDDLKRIIKEMGVGEGQPPLTLKGMLNQIDREEWNKLAAEKIPDVLGYGWARGYYFDRMQLKPAQAEFMQRAYGEEFFVNALQSKGKYADEAQQLLGADFMDGGVVSREKIKNILFGKNWVEGSKKLMKAVAMTGAAYVLGGGLAWGTNSAGLAIGARQVGANLRGVGEAARTIAMETSKLGNRAIHNVIGNQTIAESTTGPAGAGGVLQKLYEGARKNIPAGALPTVVNGPQP